MAKLDDLEAQLRGSFGFGFDRSYAAGSTASGVLADDLFWRETIAVYGDQLQAIGDPRGELIAIDLKIEDSGSTDALAIRRAELVDAWLGETPPHGIILQIRHGFVHVDATSADPAAQVRAAFDSRAAPHVRSVTLCGPPKHVGNALAIVAGAPRPSLVRLVVRQWAEQEQAAVRDPTSLIDATPYLRVLEVDGRNVLADFPHPAVRRLRVSSFDAIRTLADGRLALPELTELDLALHCHLAGTQVAPPPTLFETLGVHLPKLVDLDLSRNAPGYLDPKTLGGTTNVFATVIRLGIGQQILTLRLPPTGSDIELAAIRSLFPRATIVNT